MIQYFVSQFGNPEGGFGRFIAKVMSISNHSMYKSNFKAVQNHSKILEIGFGSGKQLEILKNNISSVELYGIDLSADMHQLATERLGHGVTLCTGDAECLPFEDDFFDAVITTDTCYFWNNPQKVLSEIKRVLKKDGIFVNTYNKMYSVFVRHENGDKRLYDDETIVKEAEKLGLTLKNKSKNILMESQIILSKL